MSLGFLTKNWSMKLFSLGVSLLLFAFVSIENSTPIDVEFRVEYRTDDDMMLVNDAPQVVHTTLRGPWAAFRSFDSSDMEPVVVNLQMAGPGASKHLIDIGSIHPPGGMRAVSVRPADIEVILDRRVERQFSVHADLAGSPAFGYEVVEVRMVPARARVVGPASKMQAIEYVATRTVDISGREDDLNLEVDLRPPPPPLRLLDKRVTAYIEISEELSQRTLSDVPVDVINGPRGAVAEPSTVSLTLKGPRRTLDKLTVDDMRASVDVASERKQGLGQAERAVTVTHTLPERTQWIAPMPRVFIDLGSGRKPKKKGH